METKRTLFINCEILSAKPAEAVLVEDGKITATGSAAELSCGAKPADMHGGALLPAFIDAHSHLSSYAAAMLQAPLEHCATFDDIAAALKRFIAENRIPAGQWVRGKGYDHNALAEGTHPTLSLLDACCPGNPVILQHASGHSGVLNTLALRALGITHATGEVAGGRYGRLPGGAPSGYLEENAYFAAARAVPPPDEAALLAAYEKAQRSYAAHGITTVQDGMVAAQMLPTYARLLDEGRLWLDTVGYADLREGEQLYAALGAADGRYYRHFKLGGYKIFLDGSPQGRTAWLREPYEAIPGRPQNGDNAPNYCGYGTMDDAEVLAAMRTAAKTGRQLLAHCNGDAAAAQLLRCAGQVPGLAAVRPVMIHAQLLGRDQLAAVKALGITPSFFVAHVWHWGDVHIRNLGFARAAATSPAASALGMGIPFTFHQDTPVIEPDMLETIACAVLRRTKSGVLLGAQERIPTREALKAVTINAARQYGEQAGKGSIAPGKSADFVLLSANPLSTPPERLTEIKVLKTYSKGECVYSAE